MEKQENGSYWQCSFSGLAGTTFMPRCEGDHNILGYFFFLFLSQLLSTLLCPGRLVPADWTKGRGWGWVLFPLSFPSQVWHFWRWLDLFTTKAPLKGPLLWLQPPLNSRPWEKSCQGEPESLLSSDMTVPSCLREESCAGYAVVLWGGGERWEQLLRDVQYDSMLPQRHAPRKCKAPIIAETFFFLNNGGDFSPFLSQGNKWSKKGMFNERALRPKL